MVPTRVTELSLDGFGHRELQNHREKIRVPSENFNPILSLHLSRLARDCCEILILVIKVLGVKKIMIRTIRVKNIEYGSLDNWAYWYSNEKSRYEESEYGNLLTRNV